MQNVNVIPRWPSQTIVLFCWPRFMGSPRFSGLDELRMHDLYLSDFPTHDMAADFVLLAEQRKAEADLKEKYEVR